MKLRKLLKTILPTSLVVLMVGLSTLIFAGSGSTVTLATIATNVGKSVGSLAIILQDLAIIAGIGFILASFFKFHQHKLNPTQVPMSQGITLVLIGAGLTLFPVLLPTAGTALVGTGNATIAQVSGSGISKLIGS
jgi:intracellular multiplication protein IcmD